MEHLTGKPYKQRDREPPQFTYHELHWSASYGPHICPACWGAGWLRSRVTIGEMMACTSCDRIGNAKIATCWALSQLDANAADVPSFQTFEPHDDASSAMLTAAIKFATEPAGWLTYWGTWGGGKSHLAEAITRRILAGRVPAVYLRAPDMYAYLGAVERHEGDETDYAGRMRFLQEIDVLVVDEGNKEKDTESVRRYRITLFDHRYRKAIAGEGGATVLVSNDPPRQWHDPALASRSQDSRFVCLETTKTDFRKVKRT